MDIVARELSERNSMYLERPVGENQEITPFNLADFSDEILIEIQKTLGVVDIGALACVSNRFAHLGRFNGLEESPMAILPIELLTKIFGMFETFELMNLSIVSRSIRAYCRDSISELNFEGASEELRSLEATDSSIADLILSCKKLTKIYLSVFPHIGNQSANAIGKNCPQLQELRLAFCPIDDDGLEAIALGCKKLRSIEIMDKIGNRGALALAEHCGDLERVNLSFNEQLRDTALITLAEKCTKIKYLNVSKTALSGNGLIEIAKNLHNIQELVAENEGLLDFRSQIIGEIRSIIGRRGDRSSIRICLSTLQYIDVSSSFGMTRVDC